MASLPADAAGEKHTSETETLPSSSDQGDDRLAVTDDVKKEPEPEPEPDLSDYPTGARLVAIVIALVLVIFLVSLDMTIVATALPKITDEFGGLQDVSWYSTAFFMTAGGFQSAWGKAYKFFPLKITFLAAVGVFELGSLICGVAPNNIALIVGRAIAGVGAAGIGSGAYTIIGFTATPKNRPMLTGFIGTSYGIAAVVGPLIGGAFTDRVTWRWCFYINLPAGGLSIAMIILFFKTPKASVPAPLSLREKLLHIDLVGVTLAMGAIISYILALQYGGTTYAWNSSQVIGLLVGFVLISLAFIAWAWWLGDRSMVPFRLASQRRLSVPTIFAFFYAGAYFLVIYFLPIYFQAIDGVSPQASGIRNLPLIIAVTIAMIGAGGYISMSGVVAPIIVAGAAISMVSTGLFYTMGVGTSEGKWIGYQIIAGVGWGLAMQIPVMMVQATSSAAELAEKTAILLFFQNTGGTFIVAAAESAFVNVLIKVLPSTAPGVDPLLVVLTGVTELRTAFPPSVLPGILEAYARAVKDAFAVGIAACGIALITITLFQKYERLNPAALTGGGA